MSKKNKTAPAADALIKLEVTAASVANYALQQNNISLITKISIINNSEADLENVVLGITSVPEICAAFSKHIDHIPANTSYDVAECSPPLNAEYLAGLTEKIAGVMKVSLSCGDETLAGEELEISALAFDEWAGSGSNPELLASFVTPNHPEVIKLTSRAAELLENWTGDPSFDAYQTGNPDRVMSQAAAVYGAVQEQNIIYSEPPASFERQGQRIRMCDTVMQQKRGTCLDLTLLCASCLEAIGLHSLLVLKRGHIFVGYWLEDSSFPETIICDAALVTKRLASGVNEIAVFECTALTAGRNVSFDSAVATAESEMTGTDPIEFVIDIKRARLAGITPLPMRVCDDNGWHIERETLDEDALTDAPKSVGETVVIDESVKSTASKKELWEKKALSPDLRNTLINMSFSKSVLPIFTPSPDELEEALADGCDFALLPRPEDWHIPAGSMSFETMTDLGAGAGLIRAEFCNRRLRTVLGKEELARTVRKLCNSAKASIDETGANTLYLALGTLRWYETERSAKARYAPVILVPAELSRRSANDGYTVRLREDEAHINVSILEKIRQEFGISVNGLDTLPANGKSIDIRRVFTIMRKAIMGQPRWDVLESVSLGVFSFASFVIWNDLHSHSGEFAKNKIIGSLIEGRLMWEPKKLSDCESPESESPLLPFPADASQIGVIEAGRAGESFVTHGPPGSGKSQTITNLIANLLADGQNVMFVAEKLAALEVVNSKLAEAGIDAFCLELHSNKSKKKDILDRLVRVMEITKETPPAEYAARAGQIKSIRAGLDSYAESLHKKRSCGMSVFELIGGYERFCRVEDIAGFEAASICAFDSADMDRHNTLLTRLISAAQAIGHPAGHPLENVGCTMYSQQIRNTLPEVLSEYSAALEELEVCTAALAKAIGEDAPESFEDISRLAAVAEELAFWLKVPSAWAACEDTAALLTDIRAMAQSYIFAAKIREQLLRYWKEDSLAINASELLRELNSFSDKWLVSKMSGINSVYKRISPYLTSPVSKEVLGNHLGAIVKYQNTKAEADRLFLSVGESLGELYAKDETDWKEIDCLAEKAGESSARLISVCGSDLVRKVCTAEGTEALITAMKTAFDAVKAPRDKLYGLLDINGRGSHCSISDELELCSNIDAYADGLKEWITWNSVARETAEAGLAPVVEAYRRGMAHEDIVPAYKKAVYKALAVHAIESDPVLSTFSGAEFNEKIEQFRRCEREERELVKQEIFCRLAARLPDFSKEATQSSEVCTANKFIRSGGRGVSIRQLFSALPTLLPKLFPCMLMSPLSVAQYLEPNRTLFDTVIFDEASQLPTCKAVGSLARAKNAIIVGDPKQMPPTSFFASNTVDEENLAAEDLESILDDCLALNMPQMHLRWHYRSRHESLIAFCNSRFYENKLLTFPSANDRERKVKLIRVDGVFERSKSRCNRAEAEAVVAELIRRSKESELSEQSVGVVTFSIPQQQMIDDLFNDACKNDAGLEKWAFSRKEPLFIKNLENVQGDERDVILFSVGYGPDEDGKVLMNFGPLNRDGGWRRLNVAVSRSRCEMVVFSSLAPDRINLSRTSSEGVSALKAFLEYADGGAPAAEEKADVLTESRRSGIAGSVCELLSAHGYETVCAVGRSEFRVDIGIIDPDNPERYLLGILLDGDCYAAAGTTRDRELALTDMLTSLGWRTLRIWTMDWWDNSEKEINRILAACESARKSGSTAACDDTEASPASEAENEEALCILSEQACDTALYISAELPEYAISVSELTSPAYRELIEGRINDVISDEAPVRETLLIKRVLESLAISGRDPRARAVLGGMLRSMGLNSTAADGQKVFWRQDDTPTEYIDFRASGSGRHFREAKDVPVIEAANAICYVLLDGKKISKTRAMEQAARLMGYSASSPDVKALFENAVKRACRNKYIEESGGSLGVIQ